MREGRRTRAGRRTLLAGSLALGLIAGGGVAWAYWTTQVGATGRSVASGTLDLTVTGASGALAGPGGTATLSGLTLANATPGASDAVAFTINNAGTSSFTPSVTTTGTGTVAPYLVTTVRYDGVFAGTTCTGGSTTAPVLAPGATVPVCVSVAIASGAPATAQNTAGTVTLALQAVQVSG